MPGGASDIKSTARPIHYAVLLSIPVLWGSYGPILQRFVLTTTLPLPFFNLLSFLICFVFLRYVSQRTEVQSYLPIQKYKEKLWRGGMELGMWLFIGVTCLAYGLQHTSANKASLILSMKSVNVSILESISTKRWPNNVNILTCVLAMTGVYLVTTPKVVSEDNKRPDEEDSGSSLVVAASIFYSIHIFRLGSLSKCFGHTPLTLASVKALVMFALTIALISCQWMFVPSLSAQYSEFIQNFGTEIMHIFYPVQVTAQDITTNGGIILVPLKQSVPTPLFIFPSGVWVLILCTVWNGAGSIGYSMWAQVFSQKHISSTAASFVYASTPLWAIFWSLVILNSDDTHMSGTNWMGALLLMTGVITQLAHSRYQSSSDVLTKDSIRHIV